MQESPLGVAHIDFSHARRQNDENITEAAPLFNLIDEENDDEELEILYIKIIII